VPTLSFRFNVVVILTAFTANIRMSYLTSHTRILTARPEISVLLINGTTSINGAPLSGFKDG